MNISKNIKTLIAGSIYGMIGLATFTSCSNEEPAQGNYADPQSAQYLELSLEVPVTRSTTQNDGSSSSGTESSFANECKINSLQLVFCNAGNTPDDDTYLISAGEVDKVTESSANGKTISTVRVKIDYDKFISTLAGKKVTVYAVANANVSNVTDAPKNWKLNFSDFKSNGLGEWTSPNGNVVPLSNAERSKVLDFTSFDVDKMRTLFKGDYHIYDLSAAAETPNVGTITLERVLARFDFKGNDNGNIYPLGETGIYLKIDKLQPVNVSKEAYAFRHTSAGNSTSGDLSKGALFGAEKGNTANVYNWIYDTDWQTKANTSGAPSANYFFNQPSVESGVSGAWTDVATLTGKTDNKDKYSGNNYHIWGYVSENTLPSTSKMIEGLSTGVAFRAVLCDAQGNNLTKAQLTNAGAAWAWTLKFAENGGDLTVTNLESGTRKLVKVDNQDAYALIYYYWNRHNDVSKSLAVTDAMEFGVVRNHVYKISLTKFNSLPRVYDPSAKDEETGSGPEDFTLSISVESWGYHQVEMEI